MEGNSVKLTWSQQNDDISGFVLFRSSEGESIASLAQTPKSTTQFIDANITPGKNYTYYVLAVAGTNKSDTVKVEIIPIFSILFGTSLVSEIGADSVLFETEIMNSGGGQITDRGVCWSSSTNPTINNEKLSTGNGIGKFSTTIKGLKSGSIYYIRPYAQNSRDVFYGAEIIFATLGSPSVITSAVTGITPIGATSGGNIESDGGSAITEKGICWSKQIDPTIDDSRTLEGTGTGVFVSNFTSLEPGTLYYVRSYAVNKIGVAYGNLLSFTTLTSVPKLSTTSVTGLTATTITTGGSISDDDGTPITSRGVCWSTAQNPTVNDFKTIEGSGIGQFISRLTSLQPGTVYYLRSYAVNKFGVYYGNQLNFTTSSGVPTLTTSAISNIETTSASAGGQISNDGGSSITSRGVCWSTTQNPTIGDSKSINGSGVGSFVSQLSGLKSSTTYYVRAYASNSITTAYGQQITFTTSSGPLFQFGSGVTDIEGNTYKSVIIGTQEWMEENLKVTKFNDGSSIPYIITLSEWSTASTPALCDWNHDIANGQTFGKLYNYYTIVDTRKLCPVGWRMPTSNDFITLESYIGASEAGKLMKSAVGWNFWPDPLQGNGNNLSGFNGLPGARRGGDDFQDFRSIAYWWTTSEFSTSTAISFSLSRENYILSRVLLNKVNGLSVRCIKN
jgi:uncharacterized protein (TIGR02145 family)